MHCKCKVGYSNHHMNTCFPNAIQTEKTLPGKGFLGRETSGLEGILGQNMLLLKVLFLGKVSWAEKSLLRKSFWERFHEQRNLCLVKFCEKSFPDGKCCSYWRQNAWSSKLGNSSQNRQKWDTFSGWNIHKF